MHVETGRTFFGGPQQVAYLLPALREIGVQSVLVCPPAAPLAEAMRSEGFVVEEVACGGDLDLAFIWRLKAAIARHAPDLVHLHSRRGGEVLGGIAARLAGVPVLLSRRVDNPEPAWLVRLKYRLYDHVVAISDDIARVLRNEGLPAQKLSVVRDAVDPKPWQQPASRAACRAEFGVPADALVLVVVAQLIERKGHRVLFAGLGPLLEQFPQLQVLCFGQGKLESELKAEVEAKGWQGRVRFPGFRRDLQHWMGSFDLLVHPALMEGMGVALLQASAAGVAIVASRVGGIPEAVADGVNGVLVPPGDVAALQAAIAKLLADEVGRQALGHAGPQRIAEGFLASTMALAYKQRYAALVV